jgi:uncharacterized membrane protein/mono/diheme cytochrome c family protein
MNIRYVVSLAAIAACCPAAGAAAEPGDELPLKVRSIFKQKCSGCHGPQVPRPSGRFGYVLNLKRLAANPEMVVAGKPDDSGLWKIIQANEMPPRTPLPPDEKSAVRDWITAGAPPLSPGAEPVEIATSAGPSMEAATSTEQVPDNFRRILGWAGRFHLLLLHFPIVFLIAAAAVELGAASRSITVPSPTVRFCTFCAAAAAVPTALLGWAYAASGHGVASSDAMMWHRWLGTATAAWAVLTALLVELDARRGKRRSMTQLMIIVGAFLVGSAAHFGGTMVHGDIFSSW